MLQLLGSEVRFDHMSCLTVINTAGEKKYFFLKLCALYTHTCYAMFYYYAISPLSNKPVDGGDGGSIMIGYFLHEQNWTLQRRRGR